MKIIVLTLTLLFLGLISKAQTINLGELSIMPGTVMSTGFDLTNEGTITNDGSLYVYRNFTNEGVVDFNTGSNGKTIFRSNAVQELSGSQESNFVNILFDNSTNQAAFELSNYFNVYGNVEFNNGVINNDDFNGIFKFYEEASHEGVGSQSFVDGEVRKQGDQAFDFPTGDDGYYRYSAISSPQTLSDQYSNQYYLLNSDLLYNHNSLADSKITYIDKNEYWRVERDQGSAQVMLTLSWDLLTTDQYILDNLDDVKIVRWDYSTYSWHDEGGVIDYASQTISTPTSIDDFGIFTFAVIKEEFVLAPCFEIYNAVSNNGDGKNDFFRIDCIEKYPNNTVEIFNRWGVKVYETTEYNSTDNVFKGYSDGRSTLNREDKLPTGTYFYLITIKEEKNPSQNKEIVKSGYLHLETNK